MCRLSQANKKIAKLLKTVNDLKDTQLQLKSDKKILNSKISKLTQDLSNKEAIINQHLADKEIQKKKFEDFVTQILTLESSPAELKKIIELKDKQIAIANNK